MNPRQLLQDIVAIPSPSGQEAAVVEALVAAATRMGLHARVDGAGNLIATAGRGDKTLLFVGHVDTVAGHIPVRVEDDVLWGRGSVDAKGSLVAALAAAAQFVDDPAIRVIVVGAVGEEDDSRGCKALADFAPDWIIVGEPSGADGITLGYRGILRARFQATSIVSHAGAGAKSAPDVACAFWADVMAWFAFRTTFDGVGGRLDSIASKSDGLSDVVDGLLQLRLPPDVPPDQAGASLRAIAARHGVDLHVTESIPAVSGDRRTPLVAAFLAAVRAHCTPRLLRKTGTADLNILAARYPDAPIVAYGPGDSSLDHTPEERLELAQLDQAVAVLKVVIATLAAHPPRLRRAPPKRLSPPARNESA